MKNPTTKTPTQPHDPAVVAARENEKAGTALTEIMSGGDEESVEYLAADERYGDAAAKFADTAPKTFSGVLAKLKCIAEAESLDKPERKGELIARHYLTTVAFLERAAADSVIQPVSERTALLELISGLETPAGETMSAVADEQERIAGELREIIGGHVPDDKQPDPVAVPERLMAPVMRTEPDPALTALAELKAAEAALTETCRLVDAETLERFPSK